MPLILDVDPTTSPPSPSPLWQPLTLETTAVLPVPALQIHLLWQVHRAVTLKPSPYVGGARRSDETLLSLIASLTDQYNISIEESGTQIAGGVYALTCKVVVGKEIANLQWKDPTGKPIKKQPGTSLTLTFSPLLTSNGGEYTCQSTDTVNGTAMSTIRVQSQ